MIIVHSFLENFQMNLMELLCQNVPGTAFQDF